MRKIVILIKEDKKNKNMSVNMKGYSNEETNLREDATENAIIEVVNTFLKDSMSHDIISTEYIKLKLEKELKKLEKRKNK